MISYNNLLDALPLYEKRGACTGYIGSSVSGALIPYVAVCADRKKGCNNAPKKILLHAAIHAREYATTDILTAQIEYCLRNQDKLINDVYFVPIVNVDGVELAGSGLETVRCNFNKEFLKSVNGGESFSEWKANLNAVDLNTNFDALWGEGAENKTEPSNAGYIGCAPESEPETRALVWFTKRLCPDLTLSYHARGREIYWDFYQTGANRQRDFQIAKKVSGILGYDLIDGTRGSAGGYKDYCIMRHGIPSLTIECFEDIPYPIPKDVIQNEIPPHLRLVEEIAFKATIL